MSRPVLSGVRVLDLTTIIAGPAASMVLADLGADVIKVERVGTGEDGRGLSPHRGPWGAYFTLVNRGKRSIALDITKPEGRQAALKIAEGCDVWMENFRGGTARRLGLDEAVVRKHKPDIIYACASGYGPSGPDYTRPGFDAVLQARTGIMGITGDGKGEPVRAGVSILDLGTGVWLALGILAALLEHKNSGRGQRVDTSLLQTGVMLMGYHLLYRQFTGANPAPQGSRHTAFAPYGSYQALDGVLMIGVSGDKAFGRLCEALGHPEWAEDPRFAANPDRVANMAVLDGLIREVLRVKPIAHWTEILNKAEVPNDPIQTAEQVMADPQVAALEQLEAVALDGEGDALLSRLPLGLSETPPLMQGRPPKLGEHTRAVLEEAGYSGEEIREFIGRKICGAA